MPDYHCKPSGPHDTACYRVPQLMRTVSVSEPRPRCLRPCPLRTEKELFPGEGPHAMSWLVHRGDTSQLATLPWTPITKVGQRYMLACFFEPAIDRLRWPA